jgi:hypothetical protein
MGAVKLTGLKVPSLRSANLPCNPTMSLPSPPRVPSLLSSPPLGSSRQGRTGGGLVLGLLLGVGLILIGSVNLLAWGEGVWGVIMFVLGAAEIVVVLIRGKPF